ncbi:DNA polymerase epsilon catalytic subunit, partial [Haematococcus lacustris]
MQGDSTVAVFDILMARTLQASEHLLWIKDPTLPDLGVADKDDAEAQLSSLLAGTGANITAAAGPPPAAGSAASIAAAAKASAPSGPSPAALSLTNQGGVGSPEVLAPGAYRSVCVELRLHNLAVAALQQCSALSDLEGSGTADAAGGPAAAAFKALRSLVMAWLHDAQVNVNEIADNLLQSLYRWLSNPGSHLYDPALQRAVQGLMAKLFAQLVSEMRKLGAVIVSANFNTIRVATGKRNVAAAV